MKILTILVATLAVLPGHAQKHGYTWIFEHTINADGTLLNFETEPPTLEIWKKEMLLLGSTNSSVCDEDGNLLAYTNGVWIANSTNQMMENGDSINYPYYTSTGTGYQVPQGAFFLPRPGHETQYYLFHMRYGWQPGQPMVLPFFLYCSLLDFSYNGGLGKVVEKNVPLLTGDGYVNFHQATAVRHANGRDWWIMAPRNKYLCIIACC